MTSSVDGSNSDELFLCGGHRKEHVYAVHPRIVVDIVVRFQGAATTVDASMIQRVRENVVQRTAVCFEMDGGGYENLL
jgi:hypothetical protein